MDEDDVIDNIKPAKTEALDTPPEEFYNQPDSIYVKLQYFEDTDMFRFEVKNELLSKFDKENVPPKIMSLCAYIRGMVELALAEPHLTASIGIKAMNAEVDNAPDGLSDEQKDLFNTTPAGNA